MHGVSSTNSTPTRSTWSWATIPDSDQTTAGTSTKFTTRIAARKRQSREGVPDSAERDAEERGVEAPRREHWVDRQLGRVGDHGPGQPDDGPDRQPRDIERDLVPLHPFHAHLHLFSLITCKGGQSRLQKNVRP